MGDQHVVEFVFIVVVVVAVIAVNTITIIIIVVVVVVVVAIAIIIIIVVVVVIVVVVAGVGVVVVIIVITIIVITIIIIIIIICIITNQSNMCECINEGMHFKMRFCLASTMLRCDDAVSVYNVCCMHFPFLYVFHILCFCWLQFWLLDKQHT